MKNTEGSNQLREIVRKLERILGVLDEYTVRCCEITMAQCHAVVEIGRAGKISLNELADLLNLENSTMSRTVNNLVTHELVKRDIDPKDRRYVTISLTESGQKLFLSIEQEMAQYFEGVYEAIPEAKREQVLDSMKILLEALYSNECCTLFKE